MAVVPVFVSSTFRDFHAERDVIARLVTPALDEVLAPYGARVQLSDLRWGVDTSSVEVVAGDYSASRVHGDAGGVSGVRPAPGTVASATGAPAVGAPVAGTPAAEGTAAAAEEAREAAAQGKVLGICLREIEESRPLFVGLLGDRFGWVPDEQRVRDVVAAAQAMRASRVGGADAQGLGVELPSSLPPGVRLSVTALEFWSGALALAGDVVIAQRQLAGVPPSGWVDWEPAKIAGREWLGGQVARVAAARPAQVRLFDYSLRVGSVVDAGGRERVSVDGADVAAFAEELIGRLKPLVIGRVREIAGDSRSGYESAASMLAESRRQVVAGREGLIEEVVGVLAGDGPGVVVHGPSGVGTTTVALAVADRLAAQGWSVASVLVGAGPGSTSTAEVIALLARQLGVEVPQVPRVGARLAGDDRIGGAAGEADAGGVVEGGAAGETVALAGEELLVWWAAVLAGQSPRTLVVVDALDRLDAGDGRDDVEVLRSVPRGGAKVLASSTQADQVRALAGRGVPGVEVGELDRVGVEQAARGWAGASGARELPAGVVGVMARRPRSGLWVRLVVQALTWLEQEDFAAAEREAHPGGDAAALTALLTREASAMPDDDAGLAAVILGQAAGVVGDREQAQRFLTALAVTRSGLAMADLQGICGAPEAALKTARWLLGGQVVQRDAAGRLSFDHQVMRAAALGMSGEPVSSVHGRVAQYLGSQVGGAADGAPGGAVDLVAVADRVWHGLWSGSGPVAGLALERSWHSPLTLEQTAQVIAAAVVSGREAGQPALEAVDDLMSDLRVFEGAAQQIGTAEIVAGHATLWLPERKRLAGAALAIARRLAAADPGNAQAARDVSVSLNNVGRVAMAGGDLAAARAAYTESLDISRRLASADPGNAQAAHDVTISLNNIGQAAMRAGDLDAASAAYTEMHDIARRLASTDPGNAQAARGVSVSLDNVGDVMMAGGDLAGARAAYTEMHDILRRLAAADPGNAQAARDVSMSLNNVGQVAMAGGDLAAARDAYTESLDIARRLASADPDNAQAARDLWISLDNVGEVAMAGGDLAAARDAYNESLDIRRRLADADPDNTQAAHDVSASLNNLGQAAMRTGDLDAASAAYTEMHDIARRLAAADPGNAQAARDLSISLNNVGDITMAGGDLAAARDAYTESLDIRRRLADADPDNTQTAHDVMASLIDIGQVARWAEDLSTAHTSYTESLAIARRLAAADPGNAQTARDVMVSLDKVGDVAIRVGDLAAARTAFTESLAIARRLAAADPGNAQTARDVMISLTKVVDAAVRAGDLAAARAAYSESLDIARRLAAADPGNAQTARDLMVVLAAYGRVSMRTGALAAARTAYTESLDIARGLAAGNPGNAQTARDVMVSLVLLAELAQQVHTPDSPAAARAWRETVLVISEMARRNQTLPMDRDVLTHFRAKAGAVPAPPAAPPAPSWLPIGAAAPLSPAITSAVIPWLNSESWTDSYAYLDSHRGLLTTQDARTAMLALAQDTSRPDHDDLAEDVPIHLAILELFTAGMPVEALEQITTEGQTALDFVMQTLTDRQTGLATRALAACPDLAEGPQGKALRLAIDLVEQNLRGAAHRAQTLAATPHARQIAAEFDPIAEALASVLDPSDVANIRAILSAS